jgi:hypothetical protein
MSTENTLSKFNLFLLLSIVVILTMTLCLAIHKYQVRKPGSVPENLPKFSVNTVKAIDGVLSGELERIQAAGLLYSIHEAELVYHVSKYEKAISELSTSEEKLHSIESKFLAYKEALGDTDLFRTHSVEVSLVSTKPDSWAVLPGSVPSAAVGPDYAHWLNKWVYVSELGVFFCSATTVDGTLSVLSDKEGTVTSEVTLLGPKILVNTADELEQLRQRWNN